MPISTDIETMDRAAIVIDTIRSRICAANLPARRLWGLGEDDQLPIALDPEMPALERLKKIGFGPSGTEHRASIVFWTSIGAQHLRCGIQQAPHAGHLLIAFDDPTQSTDPQTPPSKPHEQRIAMTEQQPSPGSVQSATASRRTSSDHAEAHGETSNHAGSIDMQAMAHELRTPIGAIIALAEMIETEQFGPLGDPRYQEYARDIGDSARLSLGIVASSLEQNAGNHHLLESLTELNLAELIQKCLRTVHQSARQAEVKLHQIVPGGLPHLIASGPGLTQILLNLLTNAVKFTPKGGTVTVEVATTNDGGISVSVRDTGVGMTAIDTEVLISDGDQANTQTPMVSHTIGSATPKRGIGFSLVRRLAEAMTAKLDVSSARGIGTHVSLTFPPEHVIPMAANRASEQRSE